MTTTTDNGTRRPLKRLSTYLNEHLADETYSVELIRRAISENEGTPQRAFLEVLSWELEQDREILVRVMKQLGVHPRHVGVLRARLAERAGRVRVGGYSPLRALTELKALDVAINAKLDMWNVLRHSVGDRMHGIDLDELVERAEGQAGALERRRLDLADDALRSTLGTRDRRPGTSPGAIGARSEEPSRHSVKP